MHLLSDHQCSSCPTPVLCCHTVLLCSVLLYIQRDHIDYEGQGAQDVHLFFHAAPELWLCSCPPFPWHNHDWLGIRDQLSILPPNRLGLNHSTQVTGAQAQTALLQWLFTLLYQTYFQAEGFPLPSCPWGGACTQTADPFLTFELGQLSKGHIWGCKSIKQHYMV